MSQTEASINPISISVNPVATIQENGDGISQEQQSEERDAKNNLKIFVNKENVTNGDLNGDLDDKDVKDSVLSNVDLNIKENGHSIDGLKESFSNLDEGIAIKPTLIDGNDDNAVDMDVVHKEVQKKEEVENDPNFAVICSFIEMFGKSLEIRYSIRQMKLMFEDIYTRVRPDLVDLHIKLLRKRRKYINKEKWESALVKFCFEYNKFDAWELERFGYQNASLSLRLRIFTRLLEAMFDYNQKFKAELNANIEAAKLRIQSYGRDISGFNYWYQIDSDLNFRLYKEEPDEDGSWSLVAKTLKELNECIKALSEKSVADIKIESSNNSDESNSNQAMLLLLNSNKFEADLVDESVIDEKMEETIKEEIEDDLEVESPRNDVNESTNVFDAPSPSIKRETKKENVSKKVKISDLVTDDFDDKNYNECNEEISFIVNDILDDVQSKLSDIDTEVKYLCDDLLGKVQNVEQEDQESESGNKKNNSQSRNTSSTSRRGRKGKRGRGRGRATRSQQRVENEKPNVEEEIEEQEVDENKNSDHIEPEKIEMPTKPTEKKQSGKGAGRRRRTELDKLKENFTEDMTTKRCSRRIQALQEKRMLEIQEEQKRYAMEMEEKRRKKEAAIAARNAEMIAIARRAEQSDSSDDGKRKRRRKKKKKEESEEEIFQNDSDEEEEDDDNNEKKKRRRRKGKGKGRRGNNPWEDSDDEDDENVAHHEDDEDDYIEEDDDDVLRFDENNEDEFACEEFDPNDEPVVVRRARTVKKLKDDLVDDEELVVNDDKPCGRCSKYDNPQWILLCDKCDEGYHTACLRPPLFIIPTGDWFCPPCEHKQLIENLNLEYDRLNTEMERIEAEKLASRKRWKFQHCDISSVNILNEDTQATQSSETTVKSVQSKRLVVTKRRSRPNGFVQDELNEAMEGYVNSSNDGVERNQSRPKKQRRDDSDEDDESDDDDDESESGSDDSSSTNSSDEDELGTLAFGKKEKKVNINDYSRSGLKLRSARKRTPISYRFKEYDQLIQSAIMDVDEEEANDEQYNDSSLTGGVFVPRTKGKDIENILRANAEMPDFSINPFDPEQKKEVDEDHSKTVVSNDDSNKVDSEYLDDQVVKTDVDDKVAPLKNGDENRDETVNDDGGDDKEAVEPIKKRRSSNSAKKKKSLTSLDLSTDEDDGGDHASDEDFRMADDDDDPSDELTEQEDNDDDDEGTPVSDSDSDLVISSRRRSSRVRSVPSRFGARKRKGKKKKKKSKSKSKKGRGRRFSDSEEDLDETEEDDDEDDFSDMSSEYEPPSKRRSSNKQKISYREETSLRVANPKVHSASVSMPEMVPIVVSKPSNNESDAPKVSLPGTSQTVASKTTGSQYGSKPPVSYPSNSSTYPDTKPNSSDPLGSMKHMNSKLDYSTTQSSVATTVGGTIPLQPPPPSMQSYPNMPPYSGSGPPPPQYQHQYYGPPQPQPSPPRSSMPPHQYPPSNVPHGAPYPPPHSTAHHYPLPPPQQPYISGHRVPGPPPPPSGAYGPPSHGGQYHPHPHPPIRHNIPPNASAYGPPQPPSGHHPPPPIPMSHYQRPPVPSKSPTPQRTDDRKVEEDYTLTNLDSFGTSRPAPVKPSTSSDCVPFHNQSSTSYPPPTSSSQPSPASNSSPPQILNLDSGTPTTTTTASNAYVRQYQGAPLSHGAAQPMPHYYPGPTGGYEPGGRMPSPSPNYPYPPPGGPSYYPQGPPPPHMHSHGPPPPPHHMPYGHHPPPPSNAGPYPHQPSMPINSPQLYMQRTPSPHQQSPSSSPYPPTCVPQPVQQKATRTQAGSSIPSPHGPYGQHVGPPGNSGNYPYPYPMQGQPPYPGNPNGGFMIQNILLNQTPPPPGGGTPLCAVKSGPKSAPKSKSGAPKGKKNLKNAPTSAVDSVVSDFGVAPIDAQTSKGKVKGSESNKPTKPKAASKSKSKAAKSLTESIPKTSEP
ncbi:respiration factor rsf1 [Blomia tropicalis]|nr:respiration factor rsf1 [Blomia tropicalis]